MVRLGSEDEGSVSSSVLGGGPVALVVSRVFLSVAKKGLQGRLIAD